MTRTVMDGTWAILDLPLPMEPVCVDLEIPLEQQLPPHYAEAARVLLAQSQPAKIIKDNRGH